MFITKKEHIDILRQLHEVIFPKLKNCWGFNPWPIIQIQVAYFSHLISFGKHKEEDFVNYQRNKNNNKIKIAEIKSLIKIYLKCFLLKRKWKNKLLKQILYISYKNHTDNFGENIYIHPAKRYFEKEGYLGTILNIDNKNYKCNSIEEYFQTLLIYNTLLFKLKAFLSKKEINKASFNANLVCNYFEKREIRIANKIADIVFFSQIQNQLFYKAMLSFLKTLSPQTIFHYNYDNNTNLAIIRAANYIGIKTTEYQHSTISNYHFAYTKWEDIDNYFYFFPAKFRVWNEFSKVVIFNNFCSNNYKPEIICSGNFHLNEQKEKLKHLSINQEVKKNNILVCLQGFWIPDFIENFIIENIDHFWYFRLHPRYPEDKEKLIELKNKIPNKIDMELANLLPLYELFFKVGFILTSFSGTALEASYFDVKTIIFGKDGFSTYEEQIKAGIFNFVSSEIELQNIFNFSDIEK